MTNNRIAKVISRRDFLRRLGLLSTLPFLESLALPGELLAQATPANKLKRLIVISQPHMASGYHRVPEFAGGGWGGADASRMQTDAANALRVASFGSDPGGLGQFYSIGSLATSPRLQREMMVVNGLHSTYWNVYGHLSNGDGVAFTGGDGNTRLSMSSDARFPLSGAVHKPSITVDQLIAKNIHRLDQRILALGNGNHDGSTRTDESIDENGSRPGYVKQPEDVFNGPVFEGGDAVEKAKNQAIQSGEEAMTEEEALQATSVKDFAALKGLEGSLASRDNILADPGLSMRDRETLSLHFDMLNTNLNRARSLLRISSGSANGEYGVSPLCANPSLGDDDLEGYLPLIGSAFMCDLSRVALMNVWPNYLDHGAWHSGAEGDASKKNLYEELPRWVGRTAEFLSTLIDPTTGRDMLESTLVLGICNHGAALTYAEHGADKTHCFSEMSYFSVGGSAALNTGMMYDAMLHKSNGSRGPVSGGIYTVNQYLQTVAAAFGLTSEQWAGESGEGFGPWMNVRNQGRPIRVDAAAKNNPMPLILKV